MNKAVTTKTLFSRETTVSIDIMASPATIWNILTDSTNYPNWNSTVISIEGKIEQGAHIELKSQLDPKRVFKLVVKEFAPESKLVWGDAMGNRTYTLTPNAQGTTTFTMTEKIGGPLFPLFSSMIPSFDQSFESFANDLKTVSEKPNTQVNG